MSVSLKKIDHLLCCFGFSLHCRKTSRTRVLDPLETTDTKKGFTLRFGEENVSWGWANIERGVSVNASEANRESQTTTQFWKSI